MVSLGEIGKVDFVFFSATLDLLFFSLFLCIFSSVSGEYSDEKMTLLELKRSVSDPYGILESWTNDSSNHCSWFGVSCNSYSRVIGLKIGGNFTLSHSCSSTSPLSLHGFGIKRNCSETNGKLVGKLTGVIGNLKKLKVLSLPFNELFGEIPFEIFRLKNLEVLDLEGNFISANFSGYDLSGLRKLRVLNLGFNRIFGGFPSSFMNLRGLRILNLAGNEINGVIPRFLCGFGKLRFVNLSFNRLVGFVMSTLVSNCGYLEHLDLSVNFLTGEIPRALGKCNRLRTLLLSSNKFNGHIPNEIGGLKSLEVLDVSRNNLSGPLPKNLGKCNNLSVLVLTSMWDPREEKLSGVALDDGNRFEGSIPDEITTLPKLEIFWAPNANLKGEFPSNWGSCKSLKMVNLAHNFLTGEIFGQFTGCPDLQYLNLSSNRLTGMLDENLRVPSITMLDISQNLLSGSIPIFANNICQNFPFIGKKLVPPYNSPSQDQRHHSGNSKNGLSLLLVAIIISATASVAVFFGLLIIFCYLKKKIMTRIDISTASPQTKKVTVFNDIGVPLTYDTIVQSTENFNRRNCIGNGGFGSTYRADVAVGKTVAVKRLTAERHQGAPQFNAEVNVLGRIKHPNLITLIGYYVSQAEMFLIYNYLPGGNLDRFIKDRSRRVFNWAILHKIALHIASALSYLHDQCDPKVLHRDIKPSNILLDNECNAYLSDFGLSKILAPSDTYATTRVAGTYGYIAPDYALTGRVSDKADVYSYGVVLMELMSDKRALDPSFYAHEDGFNVVSWVCMLMSQGQVKDVFVESLWDVGPRDKLVKLLHVAVSCTVELASGRPTMRDVVDRLQQIET